MNKLQNMEISKLRNLTALFRSFVIVLVVLILIFSYTSYVFKLGYDEHQSAVRYDENGVVGPGDNTLGGYICISMPELTYDNFIDAFRSGRFYASTGVEIKELYIDEETDELVLSCSPVKQVIVKGVHTVPAVRLDGYGNDYTSARIPLAQIREKEPFFRVELRTTDGKTAYSQPYYFE